MLPYPAVLFFFFRLSYQVLEVGAAVEQSAQTVFLCIIKVARILLENMPRPFPPQQAHISWLCNAPRWVPRPYTKHVFNCLFFFSNIYNDNLSLFLLENTWQMANPSPSLLHFCFTLRFPSPNPKPVCYIGWKSWHSARSSLFLYTRHFILLIGRNTASFPQWRYSFSANFKLTQ